MKEKNFDELLSIIENKLYNKYTNINNLLKSPNNYYTLSKNYTFNSDSNNYEANKNTTYFNYKNENDINILKTKSNYVLPYYSISKNSRNYNFTEDDIKYKNNFEESKKENSHSETEYDAETYFKEMNNIKIRNKTYNNYIRNYNHKKNTKYDGFFDDKKIEEEKDDFFNLRLGLIKMENQYNSKTNSYSNINKNNFYNSKNNHSDYFLKYYNNKNENLKGSYINEAGSEIFKNLESKENEKHQNNKNFHGINFNNINIGINNNNFIIENETSKSFQTFSGSFTFKDINKNIDKINNNNLFNRNKSHNCKYFFKTEGYNNNTNTIDNYIYTNYVSYKSRQKNKPFFSEDNNECASDDFINKRNYNSLNNGSKEKNIYIKKQGKKRSSEYFIEKNKLNLNEYLNSSNSIKRNNNEYMSNDIENYIIEENCKNTNTINHQQNYEHNFERIKNRATELLDIYSNLLYNKIINQSNKI